MVSFNNRGVFSLNSINPVFDKFDFGCLLPKSLKLFTPKVLQLGHTLYMVNPKKIDFSVRSFPY